VPLTYPEKSTQYSCGFEGCPFLVLICRRRRSKPPCGFVDNRLRRPAPLRAWTGPWTAYGRTSRPQPAHRPAHTAGPLPTSSTVPTTTGFSLLIGVPTGVRGKAPHVKGPGAEAPAGAGCPGILDGLGGGAGEAGGGAEAVRPQGHPP